MRITKRLILFLFLCVTFTAQGAKRSTKADQSIQLHFTFDAPANGSTVTDESGKQLNATLKEGAKLVTVGDKKVLSLGASNGYLDLGSEVGSKVISKLSDFTIVTRIQIPTATDLTKAGNFVWTFSNSDRIASSPLGCMMFAANKSSYIICKTNWTTEQAVGLNVPMLKNQWVDLVVTQAENEAKCYMDGILVAANNISMHPKDLGATAFNYLGRSSYAADAYLKNALIDEFCIYNRALSASEVALLTPTSPEAKAQLMLHYTFESNANDATGNGRNATLQNGATLSKCGTFSTLNLGSERGYLDMGPKVGEIVNTLTDYSFATYLYIDESSPLADNGNFIVTFANSNDIAANAKGYLFLSALTTRYAISTSNWSAEQVMEGGMAFQKGEWKHIAFVQHGSIATIYVDGEPIKNSFISLLPKALGATAYNYLGRSPYASDVYLKDASYADFRLYKNALNRDELRALAQHSASLNSALYKQQLNEAAQALDLGDLNKVNKSLDLPIRTVHRATIRWQSSHPAVLSAEGKVTRPARGESPVVVTLTATFLKGGEQLIKDYTATVTPSMSDQESVAADAEFTLTGNLSNLRSSLDLPLRGNEGSVISWASSQPTILSAQGKIITFPAKGSGKGDVVLTATLTKGSSTASKQFDVTVAEDEGYSAYLFTYFTGNGAGEEAIRFALSYNGYNYLAVNENKPVISSAEIATSGGTRDPHILRCEDGKTFYMVVTDARIETQGWSNNQCMVLLKSTDLLNWTSSVVNISTLFSKFKDVNRVWAPQTVYDPQAGKYMVYWSMRSGNDPDVIHYAYANADFTSLESEPVPLFIPQNKGASIDGDIIPKDGKYYLFYKTEGGGAGIKCAIANAVSGPYLEAGGYVDQTDEAVEGSSVFKLINSDKYILLYDMYAIGKYQFCESTDLQNFTVIDQSITMNFFPRHGTVIPITSDEAVRVANKWAKQGDLIVAASASEAVKKLNVSIDHTKNSITLPVRQGTDLTAFHPQLLSMPGATVTPATPQDFTQGGVKYTFTLPNGINRSYQVSAAVNNNPVLEGYYADPEILYSNQTGKFYLYPTTDGFAGWGGYYFKVFSSIDMVSWKDEGTMLNLRTEVPWGPRNAWAPCIVERKVGDEYFYYYYFSAAQKVGVAVSKHPTGPFVDSGKPLVSSLPEGLGGGQQIDPDVFCDPVSGKHYLYWGNGYMAVAELADDMVSLVPNTTQIITPTDGSYREGTYVFYRQGTYYFTWSEDDTGSENYRLRYATSPSPIGPLTIPANNLILAKDAAKGIYATGHNSIIQLPGMDEWYCVYHRFTRPNGINSGGAKAYTRETCIDRMEFNPDGSIKRIVPTVEGIEPVSLVPTSLYIKGGETHQTDLASITGNVIIEENEKGSGSLELTQNLQVENKLIYRKVFYSNAWEAIALPFDAGQLMINDCVASIAGKNNTGIVAAQFTMTKGNGEWKVLPAGNTLKAGAYIVKLNLPTAVYPVTIDFITNPAPLIQANGVIRASNYQYVANPLTRPYQVTGKLIYRLDNQANAFVKDHINTLIAPFESVILADADIPNPISQIEIGNLIALHPNILGDKRIEKEQFYNLKGQQLNKRSDENDLIISKTTYEDGSVEVKKEFISK